MEVTIDIDKDYKEFLEAYFDTTIENMLLEYINGEAENLIKSEYDKVGDTLSVKDKLDKIKK